MNRDQNLITFTDKVSKWKHYLDATWNAWAVLISENPTTFYLTREKYYSHFDKDLKLHCEIDEAWEAFIWQADTDQPYGLTAKFVYPHYKQLIDKVSRYITRREKPSIYIKPDVHPVIDKAIELRDALRYALASKIDMEYDIVLNGYDFELRTNLFAWKVIDDHLPRWALLDAKWEFVEFARDTNCLENLSDK